jgi:hypothetical protein
MKRTFSIIAIVLMAASCNCQEKSLESPTLIFPNQSSTPTDDLHTKVLQGDTNAYNSLAIQALDSPPKDFLFWAMHMANEYDYPNAYLDVYYCLLDTYQYTIEYEDLSQRTRDLMEEYLSKAAEMNVEGAVEHLRERSSNPEWWSGPAKP